VIQWWEGAAGALLGALIGGCIPLAWCWWTRRTERKGEIVAMLVEMHQGKRSMNALLVQDSREPLTRP